MTDRQVVDVIVACGAALLFLCTGIYTTIAVFLRGSANLQLKLMFCIVAGSLCSAVNHFSKAFAFDDLFLLHMILEWISTCFLLEIFVIVVYIWAKTYHRTYGVSSTHVAVRRSLRKVFHVVSFVILLLCTLLSIAFLFDWWSVTLYYIVVSSIIVLSAIMMILLFICYGRKLLGEKRSLYRSLDRNAVEKQRNVEKFRKINNLTKFCVFSFMASAAMFIAITTLLLYGDRRIYVYSYLAFQLLLFQVPCAVLFWFFYKPFSQLRGWRISNYGQLQAPVMYEL